MLARWRISSLRVAPTAAVLAWLHARRALRSMRVNNHDAGRFNSGLAFEWNASHYSLLPLPDILDV